MDEVIDVLAQGLRGEPAIADAEIVAHVTSFAAPSEEPTLLQLLRFDR